MNYNIKMSVAGSKMFLIPCCSVHFSLGLKHDSYHTHHKTPAVFLKPVTFMWDAFLYAKCKYCTPKFNGYATITFAMFYQHILCLQHTSDSLYYQRYMTCLCTFNTRKSCSCMIMLHCTLSMPLKHYMIQHMLIVELDQCVRFYGHQSHQTFNCGIT
jgi:hypothetical protein